MIRIGCDTGVFIAANEGQERIRKVLNGDPSGVGIMVVSAAAVFELLHHYYRTSRADAGKIAVAELLENPAVEVISVTADIAQRAAGYRHGMGLPSMDSLILATFVESNCDLMLTADHDFEVVGRSRIINVEFL